MPVQATEVLSKARRPNGARLFSGFLVSKEGQQKIADLDNVVVRKDVEPKIAVDRSKLRVIDPARRQPDRLLHGLDKRSLRKGELNVGHTARPSYLRRGHRECRKEP